ncbi:MAG: VWA domain-containing protein [Candidatus Aminicenantales bacterium]
MMTRISKGVVAASAAMGLLAFSAAARQAGTQERHLRHDAAAIIKLVPVRVLGPDGRPMTGLRKEDFSLYEDGQRKTITEFEVHALTEAGMTVVPLPPGAAEAAIRGGDAIVRKIFIFLDQQASDRAGKEKARDAALRFLDAQVRPGDQVAVIGFYAMSGFFIREYLTSDMDRIRRAINKSSEAPPSAGELVGPSDDSVIERKGGGAESADIDDRGRRRLDLSAGGGTDVWRGGAVGAGDDSPGAGMSAVAAPGTAAFQRVDFVPRMEDLVEIFKTIPGNKSLILFTARNMGPHSERLGKLFGAAGTAIHAVNTQDWDMGPFGTKFKKIWWDHSLQDLSTASGGKYFADINEAETIARELHALTGNFYVLGYYVPETWEGKYHKIRVEVARPEARVLAQDGYADAKPFAQMSDFEKDIQLIDLAWGDEPVTAFQTLDIEPLVVLGEGGARACLLTRLEVNSKSGVPPGRNEVFAFLRDEKGVTKLSRRWDMDFLKYDGQSLWAYAIVPVSAGTHDYRVIVRDLVNGEACVGRASFEVAVPEEAGIRISSPLLFEEGPGAPYLRLSGVTPAAGKRKAASEPSFIDLYRLIPKDRRLIAGETSPGARTLTVVIPFLMEPAPPDEPPILSVEAKLVSGPDGGETVAGLKIREHRRFEGQPDILVAEIVLPANASGSYDLEISIEDIERSRRAVVRKSLLLR